MWLLVALALSSLAANAQSDFSKIKDPRVRAAAVLEARKRLAGRSDSEAITQWTPILDEMHLSGDPNLKGVVQSLRDLELYDNRTWVRLVNLGYAYLGDQDREQDFLAELSQRRPDSDEAIALALQSWEANNPPQDPSNAGSLNWQRSRLAFLQRLCERRPRSEAAKTQYLNAALSLESKLSSEEALKIAHLASGNHGRLFFDQNFSIAELYLHHHLRLNRVPGLLDKAVEAGDKQPKQTQRVFIHIRAERDMAEFWLSKGDVVKARRLVAEIGVDLSSLISDNGQSGGTERLATEEKLWLDLAQRAKVKVKPILSESKVDLTRVDRGPLPAFDEIDMVGKHWTAQSLSGKVVLVTTWAAWCVPCRAELPDIQRLYEAFRGRGDRLILTINVDSSEELARRFVHRNNYSFPVLRSVSLATRINFDVGVPQNRLIDSKTQLLAKPIRFGVNFVETLEELMDQLN